MKHHFNLHILEKFKSKICSYFWACLIPLEPSMGEIFLLIVIFFSITVHCISQSSPTLALDLFLCQQSQAVLYVDSSHCLSQAEPKTG